MKYFEILSTILVTQESTPAMVEILYSNSQAWRIDLRVKEVP